MSLPSLVFASFNEGKIEDITHTFSSLGINVISPKGWVQEGPPETGETFYDNALIKATFYRDFTNLPILADDSGLKIKALDGFPGVCTSEFAQQCGGYPQAFKELEKRLSGFSTFATFVSVLVLLDAQQNIHVFEGTLEGELVFPGRGEYGFGYCPVFQPLNQSKTLGEMDLAQRTALSHRGNALRQVVDYMHNLANTY